MNMKVGIAIAVVILLLGAGGYVYMKKAPAAKMMTTESQTSADKETTKPNVLTSLKDVLTGGSSMKCTFSNDTGSTKSSGTVYTSAGKYKADIDTTVEGKVTQMHMISDGDTSYLWGTAFPTGIKMKLDTKATTEDGTPATGSNQYFDANTKANYDCQPTTVSASMFVAPTDVKFMDLSTKVPAMQVQTDGQY